MENDNLIDSMFTTIFSLSPVCGSRRMADWILAYIENRL